MFCPGSGTKQAQPGSALALQAAFADINIAKGSSVYYWLGRTQASRPPSIPRRSTMAKYLISFPSAAMVVPDGEWGAVGRDAHAVIDEAKAAGVYVFGGGIDEDVPPILVSADGAVAMGGYPWAPTLDGGFTVLELPSRDEAIAWAARIAKACRCDQELRVFGFDPQS
jgi:hypothetical protein